MEYSTDIQSADREEGFSLVEVLAAVAIIGVITFLALPNIITVRQDAEQNLAITRAEAINMATAAFIQSRGRQNAKIEWASKSVPDRYKLLAPFLAFAPENLTDYMPEDYYLTFPSTLDSLSKIPLHYDPDVDVSGDGWPITY